MSKELIQDLQKAGDVIRQYTDFYYELVKVAYRPLNVSKDMPDSIEVYRIDKDDFEIFQKLKSIIRDFEVKY